MKRLLVRPYDARVAPRWRELQAYAQLRGWPRPVNCAWITRLLPDPRASPDDLQGEGLS